MSGVKDVVRLNGREITVSASARVIPVPSLPSQGKKGGGIGAFGGWESWSLSDFSYCIWDCSETYWLDSNLLSCGKTDMATRIVHWRYLEKPFPLTVYSAAEWVVFLGCWNTWRKCVYVCVQRSPCNMHVLVAELCVHLKPWALAAVDSAQRIHNAL